MTTKLERISARCRELLALAEKRTPGKWEDSEHGIEVADALENEHGIYPPLGECGPVALVSGARNAAYIAACTGSAEAGWRSTLAAIELALVLCKPVGTLNEPARNFINAILAAWPDDLLP